MPLLAIIAVLAAGLGVALQPPTNAALARAGGSVVLASLISFAIGTALLLVAWLAAGRPGGGGLRDAPAWAWVGGFYGACFVAALAYATPRLGLASTLTLAIASQLVAALLLDRWGALGLAPTSIGTGRLLGVALVIAGAVLVRRG
ncbi:DMT family transporter [Sphingomonas rubra]|uniref:Transporter family-2 protein n=1 Tax=Sphingomonas rubra TaxID=634430 RepID=A0A1I5RX69_9SPHN|nr:DMT family transporter [Sphingomonas rubra]SFP63034.1 transporter family-2 protein [Sphingomonas rubra]